MPDRTSPEMLARARSLRKTMTGPERKLWEKLRAHRMARAHFRRQVPLGPFVVDFLCQSTKLILEVDGSHHGFPDRLAADKRRDDHLTELGFLVLRFSNWQVMNEFESVLLTIEHHVQNIAPPCPPPKGRGKPVPGTSP